VVGNISIILVFPVGSKSVPRWGSIDVYAWEGKGADDDMGRRTTPSFTHDPTILFQGTEGTARECGKKGQV
jgi:hypothetical protein